MQPGASTSASISKMDAPHSTSKHFGTRGAGPDIRAVPALLNDVLREGLIVDGEPLIAQPRALTTREDVERMLTALRDPQRRLPIIVASEPVLVDVAMLARALYGVAHVYTITPSMSFHLTERVGAEHSAYGGAIRTYRAPFAPQKQPRGWHPLALASAIMQYRDGSGITRWTFRQ
jgi:hypothetical protein